MLKSFRIPWAADAWFGEDKLTHAAWCYAGTLTFLLLLPWWFALGLVALVAALIEVVQWVRWDIEQNAARRRQGLALPRAFADQPSYRDLAWDGAGVVVALFFWVIIRWVQ